MATPKTFTDNSSDIDEANLNLLLRTGKLQVKCNYCQVDFNAATNTATVSAAIDSDGEIVTADLSVSALEINIVLSGFTVRPVCVVNIAPGDNASTNIGMVQVGALSTTLAIIRYIGAGAGDNTALDPDGNINVNVFIIGV